MHVVAIGNLHFFRLVSFRQLCAIVIDFWITALLGDLVAVPHCASQMALTLCAATSCRRRRIAGQADWQVPHWIRRSLTLYWRTSTEYQLLLCWKGPRSVWIIKSASEREVVLVQVIMHSDTKMLRIWEETPRLWSTLYIAGMANMA